MKSTIIKFILGILLTLNIILYPIGKTVTDTKNINGAMTSMDFEQKFIDIFTEITVQQLTTSTNQSREVILSQIQGDLISKDNIRMQREEQVNKFFDDIEQEKVPNFKLEIENPISKFTNALKDKAKDFINNVKDIQICSKGDQSFLCQTLGDTINSLLGRDKQGNVVDENIKPADQPNFIFETSLGIDQNNIQTWTNIYKGLKYGPDALLIASLALIALYYLFTWPKTKSAVSMLITVIKVDIFAFVLWGLIPIVFNTANPIRITSEADVQGNVNLIVSGVISETSKNALLIPLLFTAISLLMILFTIILPKLSVSRIIDDSGKIKGHGTYDKWKQENEKDTEEEEEDEEKDESKNTPEVKDSRSTEKSNEENFVLKTNTKLEANKEVHTLSESTTEIHNPTETSQNSPK